MFNKILSFCESNGFLKTIEQSSLNRKIIKIGPIGALLQETLRNEWFQNLVINKDLSVFYNENDFIETYNYVRQIFLQIVPFGIAENLRSTRKINPDQLPNAETEDIDFSKYFDTDVTLRTSVFVPSTTSIQFFHQWQRKRKMWWRQVSASPGRYSLTDISGSNNFESASAVNIEAKYSWGNQIVESLTLHSNGHSKIAKSDMLMKIGRKTLPAHHIVSEIKLSTLFLNSLCDAYEELLFQDQTRVILRFHRKLAPYKISFAVTASSSGVVEELKDLASYLCKQLRENQISCLLLPSCSKYTLDAQWNQYDQMGIPYNILLNEKTLKDGITLLRSRDSTLKEQVHVTELVTYIDKLFKNY